MCLIRVRAKLCRSGPDLRMPALGVIWHSLKYLEIQNFNPGVLLEVIKRLLNFCDLKKKKIIIIFMLKIKVNEVPICDSLPVYGLFFFFYQKAYI